MTGSGFAIEGRSIPENPGKFYWPVYEWISERFNSAGEKPLIEFGFDYINTGSVKWLYLILRELVASGREFRIAWYYEKGDDDMLELGMMYKSLIRCPFLAIEVDQMSGFRN